VADRALLRRIAVQHVDRLVKAAQGMHPVEMMRRNAAYNTGLQDLGSEYGFDPNDSTAVQRAMAGNDDYYNRVRSLYDKHMGTPTLSEAVAAEQTPANISAENAPKVVSTPK